jgi:hypothetical protein
MSLTQTKPGLAIGNEMLEDGDLGLQKAFIVELRERHLGLPNPNEGTSASDLLQTPHTAAPAQVSHQNL